MKQEVILFFIQHTSYHEDDIINVEKIESGFTNISFKLNTNDQKAFQVRIKCNPNLNRQNELKIYNELKIPLVYFDTMSGRMIREWVTGNIVKKWNYHLINLIVKELKNFHTIENKTILHFNPYIFTHLLSTSNMDKKIYTEYIELTSKYKDDLNTVCHCDLNPNNIIYDKKNDILTLLDFEWARLNSHYWELANLARENMTKKQIIYFINAYGDIDIKKFSNFLIITCLYAYQWTLSIPDSSDIKHYRNRIWKRLNFIRKLELD